MSMSPGSEIACLALATIFWIAGLLVASSEAVMIALN